MPALPIAGPSSSLRGNAETRRVINWMPCATESPTAKGGISYYLKQCPGLVQRASVGAEITGMKAANGVLYVTAGGSLYEVAADMTVTRRGTVPSGISSMAANETQLAVVSNHALNVYDFAALSVSPVTTNWLGSNVVDVLDGFGVFSEPDQRQFFISANQDFTTLSALDFASAESSTGPIIGFIVKNRELLLMKSATTEFWYDDPTATDFPLSRNSGANVEAGLVACHSLRKSGGVAYWLGSDENGQGVVLAAGGYAPQRVSTHALEEKLQGAGDLSGATAFTYHQEGQTFYALNVPGLDTTWVYDVSSQMWHERAELVDGAWRKWRATCHAVAFGKHYVGDADGNIYEMTFDANTYGSDEMVRDFISPQESVPSLKRQRFSSFQVDCKVGQGKPSGQQATMLLRYSNDGGANYLNWRELTLGNVGQTMASARATPCGSGKNRVWNIRVTDDVACSPLAIVVNE